MNITIIIIDHIGYFITGESQNFLQEQGNAVKKLAGLAKMKKIAILTIAHLRKPPPGSRKNYVPTSNDISGSAAFKQDSTEVMIVTRDTQEAENGALEYLNQGNLFVLKTKAGPPGFVQLIFSERKANIVSWGETLEKNRQEKRDEGFELIEDAKW
jgi:replicative DNA helicase